MTCDHVFSMATRSHFVNRILKRSDIGYDIKSLTTIEWSRRAHLPSIFEEIDSRNEMQ